MKKKVKAKNFVDTPSTITALLSGATKPVYSLWTEKKEYLANDLTEVLKMWAADGQADVERIGKLG